MRSENDNYRELWTCDIIIGKLFEINIEVVAVSYEQHQDKIDKNE